MARQATNKLLHKAKKLRKDEFYTQFIDIQKEIEAYLEYDPNTFKDKIVYSNCDDPYESNFFRYFVLNFKKLGIKQLITTSYKPSPIANTQVGLFGDDKTISKINGRPKLTANKFIINTVGDIDEDGELLRANMINFILRLDQKSLKWMPDLAYFKMPRISTI
jgi:hypothetical protein